MKTNKAPKKSLGQNFLRDPKILAKIANFANVDEKSIIFEIGPGEGTLTNELLKKGNGVVAIEKDERMVELLQIKFKKQIGGGKLQIINVDVLNFNLDQLFASISKTSKPKPLSFSIVGNIPYYITGALFKKIFELKNLPKSITFVVQKEVAERIMVRDEKESILSIALKSYGTTKYGGVIKAGSFFPKPKVDSAIIRIENISRDNFKNIPEDKFFEVLKYGFAHKRKLLIKNLEQFTFQESAQKPIQVQAEKSNTQEQPPMSRTRLDTLKNAKKTFVYKETEVSRRVLDNIKGEEEMGRKGKGGGGKGEKKEILRRIFKKIGVDEKTRAEDLKVEDWINITRELTYTK